MTTFVQDSIKPHPWENSRRFLLMVTEVYVRATDTIQPLSNQNSFEIPTEPIEKNKLIFSDSYAYHYSTIYQE